MSAKITENQRKFLDSLALKEGFKYYNLTVTPGSLKGDGYMGTIIFVRIEETLSKKTLNLVLKASFQGENVRLKTPLEKAYDREIFMYSVVFPQFSELKTQYKLWKINEFAPKYYGGLRETNDECLLLENLKEIGYKMWDRKKTMDSHHVGLVMKQYGKLHAFSYALKKLRPEKWTEISGKMVDIFEGKVKDEDLKNSTVSVMDRVFRAVSGNTESSLGLRRFMEGSQIFFKDTVKVKSKFSVILHGDCWCNNMMFKYEDNSQKPSDNRLLDFQLSKIGNPVLDISYFFYACASKFCLDAHVTYLKIYHDSLNETLKLFGFKNDEVMSFKDLQVQWCIYAKYGMYMAFLIIRIMLSDQEEAPDLRVLTEGGKSMMELFDVDITNNDEYNKRISILVNHMVKNRLI